MKNAMKNVMKLKILIASYYLSYHNCRFSLKVAPGKTAKSKPEAIVYAPSSTVQEAARKVIGKEATTACKWVSTSDGETEDAKLGIEVLLPIEPMANSTLSTHYFYVDSRPVSCSRGFLKGLLTNIRARYKASLNSDATVPSDPFVYVSIRCPPRSYDPNIEPSKDDVMFYDGDSVTKAVEDILTEVYGEADILAQPARGKTQTKEPETAAPAAAPQIQIATQTGWAAINSSSQAHIAEPNSPRLSHHHTPPSPKATPSPARASSSRRRALPSLPVPDSQLQHVQTREDEVRKPAIQREDYDDEDLYSPPKPRASPTTASSSPERRQRPRRRATASNWGDTMDYELSDSELPPLPTLDRPMFPSEPPSLPLGRQASPDVEDEAGGRKDIHVWNPWTAAKAACSSKPASSLVNSSSLARPVKRKPESSRSFATPQKDESVPHDLGSSPTRPINQFFLPRAGLFSDSDSDLLPSPQAPTRRSNANFNHPASPRKTPRGKNVLPTPTRTSPKAKRRRVDDMTGSRTLDSFLQRTPQTQESPWVTRLREDDLILSSSRQQYQQPQNMFSPTPAQHSPTRPAKSASSEKAALEHHYLSAPSNHEAKYNSMPPPMLSTPQTTTPLDLSPPPPYSSQPPSDSFGMPPPPFSSSTDSMPLPQPVIAPQFLPPQPHLMPPTMKLIKNVKLPGSPGRRKWWFMAKRDKGYGLNTGLELGQLKLGLQIKSLERWWERMGGSVDGWHVKTSVEGEWRVVEGIGAQIESGEEEGEEEGMEGGVR